MFVRMWVWFDLRPAVWLETSWGFFDENKREWKDAIDFIFEEKHSAIHQ